MARGNYLRGYRAELAARKELERQGYVVVRAAGSKGPVDLVAVGADTVRLVQVKRAREGKRGLAEALRELGKIPVPPCGTRELWV